MKDSLDHLPSNKQTHLRRILQVIREEFDSVVSAASGKRKTGKLIKVILFGSHATGKWVNKPETGYISDYDILVIVNQYDLVAKLDLWNTIEDRVRVFLPPPFKPECNLTVHTLDEVNNSLKEGQYFFTDIKGQGIVLYEFNRKELAVPGNLTQKACKKMAIIDYEEWFDSTNDFLDCSGLKNLDTKIAL